MTLVSDDPSYWPSINAWRISSYFIVAIGAGLTYDWVLTFGQEVELIWRQHWSLMTVLYLGVRYLGILYTVLDILIDVPTILVTDAGCRIIYLAQNWINVVAFIMLCAIMIARLHAMYQRSRSILIFLVVTFLAVNIFDGVITIMLTRNVSGEQLILSGTYQCIIDYGAVEDNTILLGSITWIVSTAWEVLALCLAVWISVKHFRELRQHSTGGIMGDCFTVLIKSHMLYFASFVVVYCFDLALVFSPTFSVNQLSLETQIFSGVVQILHIIQSFVLGPRLILSVREYNAQLVADSDAATAMTSIAFQERVHISTGSGV